MAATVLVVDDEAKDARRLSHLLEKEGFTVYTADSGREAIERLKRACIDLVLLDWRLPDIDGIEVLREIRSIDDGAIVIMISGYGDDDLVVRAIKNGACDYISKPLGPKQSDILVEKINRYLKRVPTDGAFFRTFRERLASTKEALALPGTPDNNKVKGRTLEDLAKSTLRAIDDRIRVDKRRNIRTYSDEIDLYVRNESKDAFWREVLGPQFIVECKNWRKPISSRDVLAFFGLLRLNKVHAGVFFTTSRITGSGKKKDADLILRDAKNDGTIIIVIDGRCLDEIAGGTHPSAIIKERYHALYQM